MLMQWCVICRKGFVHEVEIMFSLFSRIRSYISEVLRDDAPCLSIAVVVSGEKVLGFLNC